MPKKREYELFTFQELSKKAKERAVKDFKEDPENTWDSSDSDMLTETFEQDLESHYALGDLKVGWSLGYCQGDGVCFWGSVRVPEFLENEKEEKRFPRILKLAEDGNISVKITHTSRNCHWNSMEIEIEDYSRDEQFIPKEVWNRLYDWERETERAVDQWRKEAVRVHEEKMAPVKEWEAKARDFERLMKQGPREWTPRGPGPKPEPLNIPTPPEPKIEEPSWVGEARRMMEEERKLLDKEIEEFRTWLDERVQEISREMEKSGYEEMDYHRSDEYVTEVLENRDYEYLKDGERWER